MKNDEHNFDFDDYPNWKKGFVWGIIGAFLSTLVFSTPLILTKLKTNNSLLAETPFISGIFICSFLLFGALGAFRPT
jgi:hypothetical protein